jgi:hypothetical protein
MKARLAITIVAAILAAWLALAFADAGENHAQQAVVANGTIEVRVSVDKQIARIVDPIHLVLEVEAPRGTRVEMPNLSGRLGDFDVRSSERAKDVPSAETADVRRWVLKATLETVKTGELSIPPLDVQYAVDAKSPTFKTLRSNPVPIRIASVLENRADLRKFQDLKDVVDVPMPELPTRTWIVWTAVGVGTLLASIAVAFLVINRRRRGTSPVEWAIAAIEDLQKLPVTSATDAEAVFNEVVDIIREFFEFEFGVPTLSRTTREFLAQVPNQVGLGEMERKRLTWLARLADEIKFARFGIGEQQVRQAFEQARALIAECEQHRELTKGEAA